MEKKSKNYTSPKICIATLSDEIMEVVPATNVPLPPGAKEQQIDFDSEEEEETLPVSKSIWEDEE